MKSSVSDFLFSYPIFNQAVPLRTKKFLFFCGKIDEPFYHSSFCLNKKGIVKYKISFYYINNIFRIVLTHHNFINILHFHRYYFIIIGKLCSCVMLLLDADKIFSIFCACDLIIDEKISCIVWDPILLMLIIEPISTQQYAILSTSGHYGKRCKTHTPSDKGTIDRHFQK